MAALLVLTLALGFFLGSVYDRRRGSEVRVVTSSETEAVLPARPHVNINTAEEAQLETLPGIGPALARRIVEYREEKGPFLFLYELMNVEGIGSSTYEGLRELITLEDEPITDR